MILGDINIIIPSHIY